MVRERRVPGPEVDGIQASRSEVRDVRPGLLRLDHEFPCGLECPDGGRVEHDPSRHGIADDLERGSSRDEPGEVRLGRVGIAIRWIAEVERRGCLPWNHVVSDSRVQSCDGNDLDELQPVHDGDARLEIEERAETAYRALEGTVGEPWPCGVATRPVEREPTDDVPEAPRVDLEVGGLEDDRERRVVHGPRCLEERGERVVHGRELLAAEEEERKVARR